VQDASHILIYNAWSDGKYTFTGESLHGLYFEAMKEAAATDPFIRARVDLIQHRVPLELYDIQNDPDALHNLARDPAHAPVLARMSGYLKDWMRRYDPNPLAAFASYPDEKARSTYMAAQMKLGQQSKKDAAAGAPGQNPRKKAGKKAGKNPKPAQPAPGDENDE